MAREDLLLEVNGITKRFGGIVAVENVSFKVHEGEVISIIGPNGAGKTTVFNMLTGVYKVDEGTIKFKGEEIQSINPRDIVKKGISRTFQNIRLFSDMRVIEMYWLVHISKQNMTWLLPFSEQRNSEKRKMQLPMMH